MDIVIPFPEGISGSRCNGSSIISADHEHIYTSACGPVLRLRPSHGDSVCGRRLVLPNGRIRSR